MDGARTFSVTVKYDKLGKWQDAILEAIRRSIPDAQATYVPLPNGNVGLWVTSEAFSRHNESQREAQARAILVSVGAGVADLISTFHLFTPDDVVSMDRTASFNACFEALQSRLSGPIGYSVLASAQRHTVDIMTRDEGLKATVSFADDFLDAIKNQDFHSAAGILHRLGLLDALSKLSGQRYFVAGANAVDERDSEQP